MLCLLRQLGTHNTIKKFIEYADGDLPWVGDTISYKGVEWKVVKFLK